MRKIMFRGKYHREADVFHEEENKWVYGDLVTSPDGMYCIKEGYTTYQVDPESIGQYLEGKDVWEGDIIKVEYTQPTMMDRHEKTLLVVWWELGQQFAFKDMKHQGPAHPGNFTELNWIAGSIKVIGNLYDKREEARRVLDEGQREEATLDEVMKELIAKGEITGAP